MLLNNFFTLHEMQQDNDDLHAIISINPEHSIFAGHFPGQSVVPGVCMIQIVKELLEQVLGASFLLKEGSQIKFLQLVVPETQALIDITIQYKREGETYPFNATFKKENVAVFKMSAKLEKHAG